MSEPITYVGIDAHKVELHVALLAPDASAPVIWKVQNEARAVERLRRKLEKAAAGPVACCYEAGPCGYVLQRQLERGRVQCQVIAPALVPRKPGERIKTDRRDARKLAELHRAGLLTEVRPPTPAEEAVRDLCRARDDARADRQRCRHRLGKLLLRRGLHYPGRAWTQAHRRWVNGLTWPHPADRVVLDDYLLAIDVRFDFDTVYKVFCHPPDLPGSSRIFPEREDLGKREHGALVRLTPASARAGSRGGCSRS